MGNVAAQSSGVGQESRAPWLSVVVSDSVTALELQAPERGMLALIATELWEDKLEHAAICNLASRLGWTDEHLKRGFRDWSEGERERLRAHLVVDDASTLAWWMLSTRLLSSAPSLSANICDELAWESVRYCRAVRALLGNLPAVAVAIPEGKLDPQALAILVKLAEGLPGWHWTIVCRDQQLRQWVHAEPDSHAKAVLRAACLIETGHEGPGRTMGSGDQRRSNTAVERELGAARSALAEVIDEASGTARPGVSPTAVERARSLAELALFRLLENHPETRGLFALNVKMGFRFGPGPAEIDLFSERLQLCIEVDGPHHFVDTNAYRRDRRKDALLQRHGMWVLRVLAEDVALRIDEVLDHVLSAVRPRQAEMLEG